MNRNENRIHSTIYLLITTLVILTAVSYAVPQKVFTTFNIRKVDYLAPLIASKETKTATRKRPKVKVTKRKLSIPVPEGLIALEDFSKDQSQLKLLCGALHKTRSSKEDFRIAFYGDSFIEGDILTMDLRDSLQHVFGGEGVGLIPVHSEVSMFRKSFPFESNGWKVFSIAHKSKGEELGISGATYIPEKNADIKLFPPKAIKGIQVLYKNTGPAVVVEGNGSKTSFADTLRNSEALTIQSLSTQTDSLRQCKLTINGHSDLKIYGLNIANGKGLYLDNFSIRGNSGLGLQGIEDEQWLEFQKVMNYKLVVLQFGLNATYAKTTDFSNYEKNMIRMISHLKELFPETCFLLLSTSDRSYKEDGSFVTMPSIPLLVEAQKRIAQGSGIVFWNMYEAMGGENSMVSLVKDKKANKDYTHLNFTGGRYVADKLYRALMFEFNNFQNTHENAGIRLAVR